jgi:hypothetical protein
MKDYLLTGIEIILDGNYVWIDKDGNIIPEKELSNDPENKIN